MRYRPDLPLPPYAFYPGGPHPHPISDPAGHSHGIAHAKPEPISNGNATAHPLHRWALDLFNHGYYWEAHEAWEGLWMAAGRRGPMADFLKGLIHLAAAGVKVREGVPAGVASHARRAEKLFAPFAEPVFLALELAQVRRIASWLLAEPRFANFPLTLSEPLELKG